MSHQPLIIRECRSVAEYDECVRLQRDAFGLPDLEVSPRRHLIVSQRCGGWTLGAFIGDEMVGFVHHLVALREGEVIGYSHMMAVAPAYQNQGVGARLKWAQRERALSENVRFIKWTWDPMLARNAHFNLNRLGVVVRSYAANFYGTDYAKPSTEAAGLDSDRLFASWQLDDERVSELAQQKARPIAARPAASIEIPANWRALVRTDPHAARREQGRVRSEFTQAFAEDLVCAGIEREAARPRYLLFRSQDIEQ